MKLTDRIERHTGGPFNDRAAVAIFGDSAAEVAREALRIARFESMSRPVLLVDLLGQQSELADMLPKDDDDSHGVSDAARYGVSLNHVARAVSDADSLYVVPGGTESPLADDVLSDHLWGSWSDQCRRAGALLVVAVPADTPAVSKAIDQLDGLVMIGDSPAPATQAPVIARLASSQRPVPAEIAIPPIAPDPDARGVSSAPKQMLLAGAIAAGIALLAGAAWYANGKLGNSSAGAGSASSGQPITMPGDPVTDAVAPVAAALPAGAAPWSVEIASVNTLNGAMVRVRQALDSLPVPTFAATQPGGGAVWYRLIAGAYASGAEADSLLNALRARGAMPGAAGRVIQAPFAWLLEEGVLEDQVATRLFLWRQLGLPAYGLVDQNGTTRIYFGAFESETEARLLTPVLDSLNLYATLVTRIGSVR